MQYKLAVLGHPISHSKSPWVHGEFAAQCGMDVDYQKIDVPLNDFKEMIASLKKNLQGINITLPFKEQAYQLADKTSKSAQAAKAANTFLFQEDGSIYADNTDGVGLVRDITINLAYPLKDKRILLLGAGGAARGILFPLLETDPQEIVLINRTLEKAQLIFDNFGQPEKLKIGTPSDFADQYFDVIIDATSSWDGLPPLPEGIRLSHHSLCYDLKYGKDTLPFSPWAHDMKASIVSDGLGMLIEQAAVAFELWTHKKPDTRPIILMAKSFFHL